MNFRTWWRGLSQSERQAVASHANTTVGYIDAKLVRACPVRRIQPRRKMLARLALASPFSADDLTQYFVTDGVNQHLSDLKKAS